MTLGVNDGNMEEGSLRCDANVSVRLRGTETLGTKAEIKNLNSFRFLEDAIAYETERQIELLDTGGRVVQETRLWDTAGGRTVSMRSKEEAHDYRYFPDPDLPALVVDAARVQALRATQPELPPVARVRRRSYGLPEQDIRQLVSWKSEYFDEMVVKYGANPKAAANLVLGVFSTKMNELKADDIATARGIMSPERATGLTNAVVAGTISSTSANTVAFAAMVGNESTADEIVQAKGLAQIDDESQIVAIIGEVLAKNIDAVAKYRGGNAGTFGFLVGQVMKAAAGKANPKRVNDLLKRALEQ